MTLQTLTLTRTIQAPVKAVYRAFTTAGGFMDWLANSSDVDARAGGRLYIWEEKGYQVMGKYTALEPNQLVAFDVLAPIPGHIEVTLVSEDNATHLTLEHSKIETDEHYEGYRKHWSNALDNLKTVLETGLDRRLYNRPMIGILISGMVDKETKERLHLPLDYGILLGGTIAGMGAEAAGLKEEDALVEMNEIVIQDYYSIGKAIGERQAGDTVHIVWYRGKEKHEADMTLAGRPHPHIPATFAELAEEARQIYARVDAELAEILDGITEEAADYHPAETEWSIKEIIAHLISTERAMQIWVINAADGSNFTNWAANDHHMVKSIVDIYPTLPHLIAELRRAEGQTVALLQRLPEEIVSLKGAFHNIVTTLNKEGISIHTRLHFDTIKKLIEEAKQ